MTDLEKLREVYDNAGIYYSIVKNCHGNKCLTVEKWGHDVDHHFDYDDNLSELDVD